MAYLALDLGAGSGRAIVGTIGNEKLELVEIHRFNNIPVRIGDTLYWDFLSLFSNIKEGIRLAVKRGYILQGIAVDTWGVDFGLIDKSGRLLSNPVCYRDNRTKGMIAEAMNLISRDELYSRTGIQQMEINSVFQLMSMAKQEDPVLPIGDRLLFTPDLINFFLTGAACNEYTIASTSQLLNAKTKEWEKSIFDKLGLPSHLMCKIIHPCSVIGELDGDIAVETGAGKARVFAIGSHDTASAIAAIPMKDDNCAFLSSGTWSLLGVSLDEPVLSDEAMNNEFTNEGGVDGKILFMRNITGLWLFQRLIAEWEKAGEECTYDYLFSECEKAEPFRSIVDSDDPVFNNPGSMTAAIRKYCMCTGQISPQAKGEFVRCVLESLALKYKVVMGKLQVCTGKKIQKLYVVGGGSRNELLNRYISDALNMEVITGLTEATAIGNIVQQAIANKQLANLKKGYQVVSNSFAFKSYYPQNNEDWENAAKTHAHIF